MVLDSQMPRLPPHDHALAPKTKSHSFHHHKHPAMSFPSWLSCLLLACRVLCHPDDDMYILTYSIVTGSFAEIPKNLAAEIEVLTQQFTVPQAKLKEITAHFSSELEKGMSIAREKKYVCCFWLSILLTNVSRSERRGG